jgi:hypothetical protein
MVRLALGLTERLHKSCKILKQLILYIDVGGISSIYNKACLIFLLPKYLKLPILTVLDLSSSTGLW